MDVDYNSQFLLQERNRSHSKECFSWYSYYYGSECQTNIYFPVSPIFAPPWTGSVQVPVANPLTPHFRVYELNARETLCVLHTRGEPRTKYGHVPVAFANFHNCKKNQPAAPVREKTSKRFNEHIFENAQCFFRHLVYQSRVFHL
jgi:hypothetical protein